MQHEYFHKTVLTLCVRTKYLLACYCHYLKFDMKHDLVLKKWTVYLLTPSTGSWGHMDKLFATRLQHAPFPLIDMQHKHVLKKMNFGLCSTPLVNLEGWTQVFELKSNLMCFISIAYLFA